MTDGDRRGKAPKTISRGEAGATLLEILVATFVSGVGIVGLALMFSLGQTFVVAEGDDRVGLYLAQQKIETLRAGGFTVLQVGNKSTVASYNETGLTGLKAGVARLLGTGDQTFTRETTVECFADDLSAPETCPTDAKRITVTVIPIMRQADLVTLQSFCLRSAFSNEDVC